jgi:hypothetical protein
VSNVAVIIATGPFVAAALAWIWLREAARLRTLLASLIALCGVAIIVSEAHASSDIFGIGLACLMTLAIAAMTVAVRRHKNTPMVAAAAVSNVLGSLVSIPFAQSITAVTGADVFILAMFGFFQVALGLTLFFLGSRLLPSGQASLIATLETPLSGLSSVVPWSWPRSSPILSATPAHSAPAHQIIRRREIRRCPRDLIQQAVPDPFRKGLARNRKCPLLHRDKRKHQFRIGGDTLTSR